MSCTFITAGAGSAQTSSTGEKLDPAAVNSAEGWPAYAAVVAGRVAPQEPLGPLKPTDNGSLNSEHVASAEAAQGRKSSALSGQLRGMPAGVTSPNVQVVNFVPAGYGSSELHIYFFRNQQHA
jgi:hypothetical protein